MGKHRKPHEIGWPSLVVLAICAALIAGGCGGSETPAAPQDARADVGVDAEPSATLDSDLPQISLDAASQDDARLDAGSDADAYELPANSITVCSGFFECINDCPPRVSSCVGPCHDAMTPEAESLVQLLISCVNSNSCQNEHCIMQQCGSQFEACFSQRD